jgi:hypothetical protein
MNLEVIDVETGAGRRLNAESWYDISRVTWLADGSGLLVSAAAGPGRPGSSIYSLIPAERFAKSRTTRTTTLSSAVRAIRVSFSH